MDSFLYILNINIVILYYMKGDSPMQTHVRSLLKIFFFSAFSRDKQINLIAIVDCVAVRLHKAYLEFVFHVSLQNRQKLKRNDAQRLLTTIICEICAALVMHNPAHLHIYIFSTNPYFLL